MKCKIIVMFFLFGSADIACSMVESYAYELHKLVEVSSVRHIESNELRFEMHRQKLIQDVDAVSKSSDDLKVIHQQLKRVRDTVEKEHKKEEQIVFDFQDDGDLRAQIAKWQKNLVSSKFKSVDLALQDIEKRRESAQIVESLLRQAEMLYEQHKDALKTKGIKSLQKFIDYLHIKGLRDKNGIVIKAEVALTEEFLKTAEEYALSKAEKQQKTAKLVADPLVLSAGELAARLETQQESMPGLVQMA